MSDHSLYDRLNGNNIIARLKTAIKKGDLVYDPETQKYNPTYLQDIDTPWLHVKPELMGHSIPCGITHTIMFKYLRDVMGNPPSCCQNCWKVVVEPRTIVELFKLRGLQTIMQKVSKCGIETRPYVSKLYGGYFYNRTQEDGLNCKDEVKEAVSKSISKDISVLLKRGCTEMENYFGHSHVWNVTDSVLHWEKLVEEMINCEYPNMKRSEHIKTNIKQRWIDFAYANGDKTYLELTNGKQLSPKYVLYERQEEV